MPRRQPSLSALLISCGTLIASATIAADHQIGVGIHYWQTVDSIEGDFGTVDDAGESYLFAYQIRPSQYFRWELDLEFYDEGFQGADEIAISPVAYALVGKGIYGGLGVGIIYSDGFVDDNFSDTFYVARAGFDVDLLPHTKIDLHGSYRVGEFDLIDEPSSDTISLGALVRFDF